MGKTKKKADFDSLPLAEQVAQLKRSNSSYRSRNTTLTEELKALKKSYAALKEENKELKASLANKPEEKRSWWQKLFG